MSENRVIGNANAIPWHVPEDFQWVKQATKGKAIAMGRRTFESIGKPLQGRTNIVISRSANPIPGCTVLPSLEALKAFQSDRDIWIFGGATLYQQALPFIDSLFLTIIRGHFDGDTFFPPFEHLFSLAETIKSTPTFEIRRYTNFSWPH